MSTDAGREIEERVLRQLRELDAWFEVIECDPELADTENFCKHYGVPLDRSANCIVVASRTEPREYCACLVLSTDRLDVNKTVRRLMGVRKASFAPAEETADLTGMLIGGVTPFALPTDLPLYIDRAVMEREWVVVGGGSRSQKLKVRPEVFDRLSNAKVVDGLAMTPT